jgi:hypothetical protein
MNKQEIEKAIEYFIGFQGFINDKDDATFTINKEAVKTAISALQQQLTGGWIPVSSGIYPKEILQRVLATLKNEMVLEVWYISNEFKHHETIPGGGLKKVSEFNPVVAWQPLPEPWKEEANA